MIYFLFLLTYLIGYVAGYLSNNKQTQKVTRSLIKQTAKTFVKQTIQPGIIRRPTVKQLHDRNLPQLVKDSREAMKGTLDAIPELQEHKRLLKQLEKIQP